MARRADDRRELLVALRHVGSIAIFGVLPAAVVIGVLAVTFDKSTFQYDFHGGLYDGARAVIHGRDPYPPTYLRHLAAIVRAGGSPRTIFAVPVYPAPALVAAVPFALLGFKLAAVLWILVCIAAMIGGLWLLGVRDWRCYGIAFLSWPLLHSLRLGQINEVLLLVFAIAWRWRRALLVPAAAVGCVVVSILFVWPLGVFELLTRRFRVVALAAVIAVCVSLIAWGLIGFGALSSFPGMLNNLALINERTNVSLLSIGLALGLPRVVCEGFGLACAAGVLALAWWLLSLPGGERRAFGLAVVAALIGSPLVWPHYLTLIFIPIALLSPSLSMLWLVPLISYLSPIAQTNGDVWKMLPYLAIELIVLVALCAWEWDAVGRRDRPERAGRREPVGAQRV